MTKASGTAAELLDLPSGGGAVSGQGGGFSVDLNTGAAAAKFDFALAGRAERNHAAVHAAVLGRVWGRPVRDRVVARADDDPDQDHPGLGPAGPDGDGNVLARRRGNLWSPWALTGTGRSSTAPGC